MKRFCWVLLLINLFGPLYSQTNTVPKGAVVKPYMKNHWDENKFVWSHVNHDPGKPLIDFEAIDNWACLGEQLTISRNGQYFAYTISKGANKYHRRIDSLVVQSTLGPWRFAISGAQPGFFSGDSKKYIFKDHIGLSVLNTGTGECKIIKNVLNYTLPYNGKNNCFVYQLKDTPSTLVLHNLTNGNEKQFKGVSAYRFDQAVRWLACQSSNESKELVVYELTSEKEKRFLSVAGYSFNASGKILVLKTIERAEIVTITTLQYVDLLDGVKRVIWSSMDSTDNLLSYNFDNSGKQLVFTIGSSTKNSIWYWRKGMDKGVMKVNNKTAGIEDGLQIGKDASFTENDRYIQFTLHPEPDSRQPNPDAAPVDVWSYKDVVLQSSQQWQTERKAFTAIINPLTGFVIQLNKQNEEIDPRIKGDYAIISQKCCGDRFWEQGFQNDSTWLLSLLNGKRRLLSMRGIGYSEFSPDGRFLVFFDNIHDCNYFSYNLSTDELVNISKGTPPFQFGYQNKYLITSKKPTRFVGMKPFAAWINDDKVLVYDNYDIWQLDLLGKNKPINITNGYGVTNRIKFELSDNGAQYQSLSDNDTLLIKAFNKETKYNGYYRKVIGRTGNPVLLYMGPCFMERLSDIDELLGGMSMSPLKAAEVDMWIVRRETATQSPNYFLTRDFKNYKQLTWLAPQNAYNWYSTELHSFKQLDGTLSQGVLYKPENFNPNKKYPVIISFYTYLSDNLYQYAAPDYIWSPIIHDSPAWIASHGYLVFVPDIYFTKDKWGPSTVNTMDGAAKYLNTLPYVDGKHLGAVGHSNSGRFGYHLLTHSKLFAAMSIGSATTNALNSAFYIEPNARGLSMLEWTELTAVGTGLGNLWQNKESWLDQTAVLHADKVTSPLLLFHCKRDGVPYEHAIAMYTSLRRLEKKCWWVQYDQGGHTLGNLRDLRDFTIRYTQYFDHYLKGAPAPRWMTEGIPASLKTIESRYELDPGGLCGKNCEVCKQRSKISRVGNEK